MPALDTPRIAYVVKRYPRFSETFIVNEILEHEASGWKLDIFTLRPCCDAHFQDRIARVRAEVNYLPPDTPKAAALWKTLAEAASLHSTFSDALGDMLQSNVHAVFQAMHLAAAVKRRGIEHLHAHFATGAAEVTRLAAGLAGVSYTLTAHAKDIFHEDVCDEDLSRKFAAASTVITVSDFNLQYLQQKFPGLSDRFVRLFNGIDLSQFTFEPPRERSPLIVGVGRLVEKKGFGDLIDACSRLRDRGRTFRCEIIGDGDQRDSLMRQIRELELGRFVMLTGGLPQVEVIRRVQQAALVAAPCVVGEDGNRDGMPTVLLEAMALGTPCVATDVTGIPEIIVNDETGIVIPQHSPDLLAQGMERLFDEEETRLSFAHAARARIERDFDIHLNAQRQRQLFSEALAHRLPVSATEGVM